MLQSLIIFNPRPHVQTITFSNGQSCFIVDDAIVNADALRQQALDQPHSFQSAAINAYPGVEFPASKDIANRANEFFMLHIRRLLNARRTLHVKCRFSLATLPPDQLQPCQWLCHRDTRGIKPEHCVAASVLYLFHDEALGGTSFFTPKNSSAETEWLVRDSCATNNEAFQKKYGIGPGYFTESNDYFEKLYTAPAKWNRMVFYDGDIFHSGDIRYPEKLAANPLTGRLTLNGFFTCSRNAT